jgi:Flp pilus assembly pilin Flp
MMLFRRLARNEDGAAVIEMAFALPILIVLIWMFVQMAQVYRAMAGMQQALGEGARYATLCIDPDMNGCTTPPAGSGDTPEDGTIKKEIEDSVYGIGPGDFSVADPVGGQSGTGYYYDLSVRYQQDTNLLLLPGPHIDVTRSKRVWVAGEADLPEEDAG